MTAAPSCELTILMPCLNEAETLETCIRKALGYLERAGIDGEVLIADNGSTDGSQAIATGLGARVVDIPEKGYGAALIGGIEAAAGRFVIMGDADDSYDFSSLDPFVEELRGGAQLVMGNRFRGGSNRARCPRCTSTWATPCCRASGRCSSSPASATSTAACAGSTGPRCSGSGCAPRAWSSPPRWWSRRAWPGCGSSRSRPP
ncbi:glycosyltransferase family 2 protein [Cellulomonas soli]